MNRLAQAILDMEGEVNDLGPQIAGLFARKDDLTAQRKIAEIQLCTLLVAASLVDGTPQYTSAVSQPRGKQRWQITQQSRQILAAIVSDGNAVANQADLVKIAASISLKLD